MPNVKILERIHHGQYRHKRVIELHALTELTVRGVLASSAYPDLEPSAKRVRDMLDNLKGQGAYQLGWADFEVLTDEHEEAGAKAWEPTGAKQYANYEVFFLLHRGNGIPPYRTNAMQWARDAEHAVELTEASTKSDCSYSWSQCQLVGVIPSAALDSMPNMVRRDFKDAMWEAAE
jgi:hypothetical protein